MKVELSQYKKVTSQFISQRMNISIEMAEMLIDRLGDIIDAHLPCSKCGEVLPKESFHKCSSFPARDGRYTICRSCKAKMSEGKGVRCVAVKVDEKEKPITRQGAMPVEID